MLFSLFVIFPFIFSAQSIGTTVNNSVHNGRTVVSVTATSEVMTNNIETQLVRSSCPTESYTFGLAFHYHHHWSAYHGLFSGCDSGTYTMEFKDIIGFSAVFRENIIYCASESGSITCNNAISATPPTIAVRTVQEPNNPSIPTELEMFQYSNLIIVGNNGGEPTVDLSGVVYLFGAPAVTAQWSPSLATFSGELSLAWMHSANFNYYCPYPIAPGTTLTGYGS